MKKAYAEKYVFYTYVKDTSPSLNWIKTIHFHIQAERDESADVIIFFS